MTEKFGELDVVALKAPMHDRGLWAGEEGTIVNVHRGGASYTVEFMRGDETIDVVEIPAGKLRRIWAYTPQAAHAS